MKKLIFLSLSFILLMTTSCNNNPNTSENIDEEQKQSTDLMKKNVDVNTWETFWVTFQAAAKQKDIAAIKKLSILGEVFPEKEFDELSSQYFSEKMFQLIIDTSADNLKISEGVVEATDARELYLDESGYDEEEGVLYESALILYFGKVDGKYGLVMWMAAG